MITHDYLVEMQLTPAANVPSPQEGVAFTERFVLPTLDACEKLIASGVIVAGGPVLAGMSFSFVARVASPQQLEDLVAGLPLWPRARTRIVPLGTFRDRAAAVRRRLERTKATLENAALAPARN